MAFRLCAVGLLIPYLISADTSFITGTRAEPIRPLFTGAVEKTTVDSLQLAKKRTEGRGRERDLRASLAHWISLQATLTPRGFWRGLKVGSQGLGAPIGM